MGIYRQKQLGFDEMTPRVEEQGQGGKCHFPQLDQG